jgi:hypothetical protein
MKEQITVEDAFARPWIRTTHDGLNVISITRPWRGKHPFKVVAACKTHTATLKVAGFFLLTVQQVVEPVTDQGDEVRR